MKIIILTLNLILFCSSIISGQSIINTKTTNNLLKDYNKLVSKGKTLFGVANGLDMSYEDPFNKKKSGSDLKKVFGVYPAFVENDFLFSEIGSFWKNNIYLTKKAHKKGIKIGYCWHLRGMNSNSFYKKDGDSLLAAKIIDDENSIERKWFINLIDSLVVSTFKELKFPIVFRPFHEMNGGWFWWGKECITPQQYIKLYRLTVETIKQHDVKNVLFSWSPDTFLDTTYYPGDNYVDICGLDIYEPNCSPFYQGDIFTAEIYKLLEFTKKHNKIAAITETGCREFYGEYLYPNTYPNFWTEKVLSQLIDSNGKGRGIAYAMAWYNCDWQTNAKGPFYIPYPGFEARFADNGRQAVLDFKKFLENKCIIVNKKNIKIQ